MISNLLVLPIQIGVILIMARLVGWGLRSLHQPQVIGEIVSGILLGPSLLGWLAPDVSTALFPSDSLGPLNTLGQIGAILFIFFVGLRLNLANIRACGRSVLVIALGSIVVPMIFGTGLAIYLYPSLSDTGVTPTVFALFTGVAMTVTALPVLARILEESRLSKTPIGTIALAIASVKDVTAWGLLAGVMALQTKTTSPGTLLLALLATGLFVYVMLTLAPRAFDLLEKNYRHRGHLTNGALALILLAIAGSAWMTEWFGVHALFGAFLAGVALPKTPDFVSDLSAKFEGVTTAVLLPIFFASTGLRTSFGLIQGTDLWVSFSLILLVAVAGMWGGTALAARWTGMSWSESNAIGILMNTRGLMEIVILTIGLDIGAISSAMYGLMLLMAITTTCMTSPLLRWWCPDQRRQPVPSQAERSASFKKS